MDKTIQTGAWLDTIMCGDCLNEMPKIPAQSVDVIISDLPYGTTACKWDSVIPFESLWSEWKRLLKPNSAIVLMAMQPFTTMMIASNIEAFKYCWVWDKMGGGAFVIAKHRPMQTHEDVVVFGFGKMTYNPQMEEAEQKNIRPVNLGSSGGSTVPVAGGVAKSAFGYDPKKRYPRTVIRESRYGAECNSINRVHPTQKPLSLMRYFVRTYTNPGDVILDPCCGSGTTCIAAIQENRHYIGIEKETNFVEITRQRICEVRGLRSSTRDRIQNEGVDMEKSDIPVKVLTPDEANVAYAEAYQKYGADAKETEDARIAYEQALKDASDVGK
jgi:site-specific DNA-methyltransferase (adenine-specific)